MVVRFYLLILSCFFLLIPNAINAQDSIALKHKAAQMLIIGFRGTELKTDNPIYTDIIEHKIGGVILFDYDSPSKSRPRNITSPAQLKKLNTDLQKLANGTLFISVDQEGGAVSRLKERYGFPFTHTAQYLGKINNVDTTAFWAQRTAETLYNLGFNLNFAPDVDVNINPKSPAIGKWQRSFSAEPDIVINNAHMWINKQSEYGIMNAIKHFPGHGSAGVDTHQGMADVTDTWDEKELIPFQALIDSGIVDMVMTSHIINKNIDSVPATLSYNILTQLLRKQMNFNGIIVSDDIAMGAIANHYSLAEAIEKAVNAGVDILILSNNGNNVFDSQIATKAINIICSLVESGNIKQSRIDEAYNRIMLLKYKNGLNVSKDSFMPHKCYNDE